MRVDDCLLNVSRLIKFNVHLFGLRGLPFACSVTSGCNATSTCVKVGPLVYSSWMQSLHSSFYKMDVGSALVSISSWSFLQSAKVRSCQASMEVAAAYPA